MSKGNEIEGNYLVDIIAIQKERLDVLLYNINSDIRTANNLLHAIDRNMKILRQQKEEIEINNDEK